MSKTYLIRTEARGTTGDLAPGLAARIADPLWLLGRQWQFGELLGEDTGSPVSIELAAEAAQVSRFVRRRPVAGTPYDPAAAAARALTGDPIRSQKAWTARMRVDAGREFVRALGEAGSPATPTPTGPNIPIEPADEKLRARDPAGARLVDVAGGRIPDGARDLLAIAAAVRGGKDSPSRPRSIRRTPDAVRTAAEAWIAWCDETLADTGPSTWDDERLAHCFGVATGTGCGGTVLDAEDFGGIVPDWHSFDVAPNARPTGFTALPTTDDAADRGPVPGHAEPALVGARGCLDRPRRRRRRPERRRADGDARVRARLRKRLLRGPAAAPGRLAVPDHVAGRQRHVRHAPARPIGRRQRARGRSLVDVHTHRARSRRHRRGVSDLLFLAPVAGQLITSEPVEEVLLLRDEMANLAWAVERRYEGETRMAADRHEEHTRALPDLAAPDTGCCASLPARHRGAARTGSRSYLR